MGNALQADNRIAEQGQAPQLAVVLAQIVSRYDRTDAFRGSHGVDSPHRRMRSIQVGGLNFHIADALLPGEPILPRE